jgi:hypothetical protein
MWTSAVGFAVVYVRVAARNAREPCSRAARRARAEHAGPDGCVWRVGGRLSIGSRMRGDIAEQQDA